MPFWIRHRSLSAVQHTAGAVRVASPRVVEAAGAMLFLRQWANEAKWRLISVDSKAHGFLYALSTVTRKIPCTSGTREALELLGGHDDALPHRFHCQTVTTRSVSNGVGLGG